MRTFSLASWRRPGRRRPISDQPGRARPHCAYTRPMRMPDVNDLARRHGVSVAAVQSVLTSLRATDGRSAQFDHPDLGGRGQWMPGMVQVGDMFNTALKAKVDALLCRARRRDPRNRRASCRPNPPARSRPTPGGPPILRFPRRGRRAERRPLRVVRRPPSARGRAARPRHALRHGRAPHPRRRPTAVQRLNPVRSRSRRSSVRSTSRRSVSCRSEPAWPRRRRAAQYFDADHHDQPRPRIPDPRRPACCRG